MSEVKVNKISPRTACGTVTLGDSGDTFTIPSGATITNAGTATGFGATGAVSWNTTKITADPGPAVTGTGYFCDTSGGAFTVTLPLSPSAGDVVGVSDYAKTWDTNNLTLGRNSEKIAGEADDSIISTEGSAVTLVYVDSTKGWIVTDSGLQSDAPGPIFITATGGTPCAGAVVDTNYKQHTFTGPGTLCVSCAGNPGGSSTVDYMVVGGGGGGGRGPNAANMGGGGGAGGYRESPGAASGCYTVSPLGVSPAAAIAVSVQGYPITAGGGGTGGGGTNCAGGDGNNSSFSTITSTAGGGGGGAGVTNARAGGSGGGAAGGIPCGGTVGAGNTPPVSPAQGNNGGQGSAGASAGAGGGATAVGGTAIPGTGGTGGAGATSSINGTPTARAGGGGGNGTPNDGAGGAGGGGSPGCVGTVNTGGGGGGTHNPYAAGAGGSGIVIIRYKFQ